MKVKLTKEYLKKIKVTSDGIYDVPDDRAKELVDAGNAEYFYQVSPAVAKEVKNEEFKVMRPRKRRVYKTK